MAVLPIPPKVYHPRAVVLVSAILDDHIPGSPGIPATWPMIPRSVTWTNTSARKANSASVELDFRDFPLDPRMLKDVLVTIHAEDALDPSLPLIPTPLNKRFVGLVDKPETKMDDGGEVVSFDCRDYTGIWLDTKMPTAPPISLLLPLSAIVEAIKLLVTPLLPPVLFLDPAAAALVPGVTKGKTLLTVGKGDTAWDVLTKLCALYALVPVFDVDVLTIRSATRFGINRRKLVYGQNVESLSFRRDLTSEPATKKVVVNCWNPVLGIPVQGFYPAVVVRTKMKTKGIPQVSLDEVTYNVHGNYSIAELILIAKRIYDEQATQEVEGELTTKEMADSTFPLGLGLLGLSNGDTLDVRLGRDLHSSIAGMSPPEAIAFLSNPLKTNSLNPVAAAALVQAWTTAGVLAVSFYVREAVHTWDRDGGYNLNVSFINFLLGQGI